MDYSFYRPRVLAGPRENKTPAARPPKRFEIKGRVTRRGELILDDGRKFQAHFGRPWKQTKGPPRQIVKTTIDGRAFSGIMINTNDVKLLATERRR